MPNNTRAAIWNELEIPASAGFKTEPKSRFMCKMCGAHYSTVLAQQHEIRYFIYSQWNELHFALTYVYWARDLWDQKYFCFFCDEI